MARKRDGSVRRSDDVLVGTPGDDAFRGDGRGDLTGDERGGDDRLYGLDGTDTLIGDVDVIARS
jgi:hypothetical protein